MTYLPDVNVWVALAVAEHVHQNAARQWLDSVIDDDIAFCRVTQMGLLRLLTNPSAFGKDVLTASTAWKVFDLFAQDGRVVFAPEPAGLSSEWRAASENRAAGANFWTDAYLAAFAMTAEVAIVTFDRGFRDHRGVQVRLLRQE